MGLSLLRLRQPEAVVSAARIAGTRILGGGTLLVRQVNMGDVSIDRYVRHEDNTAHAIAIDGAVATLGARVSMAAILADPALSALAPAARAIGSPAVRQMASIGGNLHAPPPYGDFATLLLALGAHLLLHDGTGVIRLPIDNFLARRATRDPACLVLAVEVTLPGPDELILFKKIGRTRGKGAAVLTLAARLRLADDSVAEARIALGAVCEHPVRAAAAESHLVGASLSAAGIAAAVAAVGEGLIVRDDALASAWYRREVLPVHLRRLLLREGGLNA